MTDKHIFYLIGLQPFMDNMTTQYLKSLKISPIDTEGNYGCGISLGVGYSDCCRPLQAIIDKDAIYFDEKDIAENILNILHKDGYIEASLVECAINTDFKSICG